MQAFRMAYQNEATGSGFVLSNGSVGHGHADLTKFSVHKRAVSSKKMRAANKKKSKTTTANSTAVHRNPVQQVEVAYPQGSGAP